MTKCGSPKGPLRRADVRSQVSHRSIHRGRCQQFSPFGSGQNSVFGNNHHGRGKLQSTLCDQPGLPGLSFGGRYCRHSGPDRTRFNASRQTVGAFGPFW